MTEPKKLKEYFGRELAILLAEKLSAIHPGFHVESFVSHVEQNVDTLELKDRVNLIAHELKVQLMLDGNYLQALNILVQILGPENPKETGMFKEGYWLMPVAKFVELFGLEHYDASMQAIYEITKRHTGEYAVRPYIEKDPQQSLMLMKTWAHDANVHVRRLASEGLRPRLPWAKKLTMFIDDPSPVLEVLDVLKTDSSPFVKKSVANNMNDILKDNYAIAMEVLRAWSDLHNTHTNWIIKHALRNRLKHQDPEALNLIDRITKMNKI